MTLSATSSSSGETAGSVLLVVPTYNEKDNLPLLVPQIRRIVPHAHVLIVDDSSPDGTGRLADTMAAQDPHLHVLHRTAKDGLGRAYIAGFGWALPRAYSRIVQMDADLSHDPKYLPQLLQASQTHDLALGSRYVPGGGTANWGLDAARAQPRRQPVCTHYLGLRIRDLTGGFKCWRRHVLEDIDLPSVRSNGYSFQIEMTYRALLRGHTIQEVPIVFADRTEGQSKMSKKIVLEAIGMVWKLRAQARAIRAARPDTNSSGGATLGAATKS
jgi:dolichol-phosphate mannosyltransferase